MNAYESIVFALSRTSTALSRRDVPARPRARLTLVTVLQRVRQPRTAPHCLTGALLIGDEDDWRAMMSASPSLADLAKSYETTRKRAPRSLADIPTSTQRAEAFAKQLKSHGYRFVGPTSVYAFMQNVGVVNDHIHGCFRAVDYPAVPRGH